MAQTTRLPLQLRCIRVALSDIRYDLGKIVYGRVCDFDSEIHFGMSARTSSIDLLSSG
jgi:hypothetical protein